MSRTTNQKEQQVGYCSCHSCCSFLTATAIHWSVRFQGNTDYAVCGHQDRRPQDENDRTSISARKADVTCRFCLVHLSIGS